MVFQQFYARRQNPKKTKCPIEILQKQLCFIPKYHEYCDELHKIGHCL